MAAPGGGRLGKRAAAVWALQSALVALVLLMLWQPALSVSSLKTQQNVVAVVVDDSRSMALAEGGASRKDQALRLLESRAFEDLKSRFQVRLYRLGANAARMESAAQLTAALPATHLADGLKQVASEAATLPIGAMILMSDGSDNAGGIDAAESTAELRRTDIPIHTVGFGRERPERDAELLDVQIPTRALADSRLPAQIRFQQFGLAGREANLVLREGGRVLAREKVTFRSDGTVETRQLIFNAGIAGAKSI